MTAEEKAKELFYKFWEVQEPKHKIAKKYALIAIKNEYHSLREMLIHFQATRVINDEKFYLKFLQKLIDEEQEIKQEIEKL
jgi:hypothetical protein